MDTCRKKGFLRTGCFSILTNSELPVQRSQRQRCCEEPGNELPGSWMPNEHFQDNAEHPASAGTVLVSPDWRCNGVNKRCGPCLRRVVRRPCQATRVLQRN